MDIFLKEKEHISLNVVHVLIIEESKDFPLNMAVIVNFSHSVVRRKIFNGIEKCVLLWN